MRYVTTIVLMLAIVPLEAQERRSIGLAEWVHPDTTGQPPAEAAPRSLSSGARVEEREQVRTNPSGAADFVFLNRSRLLVGPGCDVRLDHRYYDRRLDVQVSEYSLATRRRCIAKADNFGARDPADRIVIKTPHGTAVIANAEADILLEAAPPGDRVAVVGSQVTRPLFAGADEVPPPLTPAQEATGLFTGGSARQLPDASGDQRDIGSATSALTSGSQGAAIVRISVNRMGRGGYATLHQAGRSIGPAAGGVTIRRADFFAYIVPSGGVFGPERERIVNLSDLAGVANPPASDFLPIPELAPLRSVIPPNRQVWTAPPTCRRGLCEAVPQVPVFDPPVVVDTPPVVVPLNCDFSEFSVPVC